MTADSGGHDVDKPNRSGFAVEAHIVDKNKARGKAEQLKGKVEQAVGKATGSEETQARGEDDEARGKARENVADLKSDVNKVIGKVKSELNKA